MPRIVKPPEVSWKGVAERTWKKGGTDDIRGRSAQLAYYFFLALFPLLIFVISAVGVLPGAGEHVRVGIFHFLSQTLPASASDLVQKTMNEVASASGIGKLSFGLIVSLWSASAGMMAVMDTLNAEHGVAEERSFLKQRAVAIGLTLIVASLIVLGVAIVLIGESRTAPAILLGAFSFVWKIVQWPAALTCVLFSLALMYYFAPNLRNPEWHWITPGAIVGSVFWLVGSMALRLYLQFFDSYSATYGSLGAVIVLLISFYVTGIAILIGGEVNVVIEDAVGQNSPTGHSDRHILGGKAPPEGIPAA